MKRAASAIIACCALLQIAWGHPLAIDEVEFFRATRWTSLGRVPFRDFWELHAPLQWYVFAPIARFLGGSGTLPLLILRWAQLPLWIVACWSIWRLARNSGRSPEMAGVAMALLWLSRFFADFAIEYRVDAVAVTAFAAALAALMSGRNALAGVLFGAAAVANLRFVPVIAVAVVLLFVVDFDARAWRFVPSRWTIAAGAAAVIALCACAMWTTGSWSAFWQHAIVENAIGDRNTRAGPAPWATVLASIGGIVPHGVDLMLFDVAGIAIVAAGAAGAVMALAELRRPTFLTFLSLLQIGNLLFIARMKVVYPYHYLLTFLAAVPLVALALERAPRRLCSAALVAAMAVRLLVTLFGANHGVLTWQNIVMKEAERRTVAGEPIFDGVGWVQTRPPAYGYWFLPLLARIVVGEGYGRPYTVADAVNRPPGVLIVEQRMWTWFHDYPSLAQYFRAHYVALNENLWIPALSGRFDAGHRLARWIVPRGGRYRIVEAPRAWDNPWFTQRVPAPVPVDVRIGGVDPKRVTLRRDGVALDASAPVMLARGDRIEATATAPTALFIVPDDVTTIFQPAPGLEAGAPAAPHLPWR